MAGKNNFYPYGESSTNILNNSEYQTDQERTAGAARGAIARSKIYNKALRQGAAGAYAVADLVAAAGKDADDASAATLAENFRAAVSYQARAFVASAVNISGGLATATVDELATTAKDDLPALFSLAMVLDQSLPAGSSIKIASSLPDTDLTFPIYSGGEVLEDDVIVAGAISLMIDTIGGKAFFRAGGMGKLPSDLAPLCPNFKVERNGGKIKISADKIQLNPYTNMVQGGVWAWGKTRPVKPTGTNLKQWTRAELITTGKPYDGLYLGDVTPSDAVTKTLLWLPENISGKVVLTPFVVLSVNYLGGVYVDRLHIITSGPGWFLYQSNVYEGSPHDDWYQETYLNSILDSSVVSQILEVDLPSGAGTIKRKVFGPSYTELFGQAGDGLWPTEGKTMPYFTGSGRLKATDDKGAASGYAMRTTRNSNTQIGFVDTSGSITTPNSANGYMRPGFILPKDFKIQQRPDGSYTVWDENGLQTLADIEPSSDVSAVYANITEGGKIVPTIFLNKEYSGTEGALLLRNDIYTNAAMSSATYQNSGADNTCTTWATTVVDEPYRAKMLDIEVKYYDVTKASVQTVPSKRKAFILGSQGLNVPGADTWPEYEPINPYFNSNERRNVGAKYWVRDKYSGNDAFTVWYLTGVGGGAGYENGMNANGIRPACVMDLTTPIRALADGTYDLVPDDPALATQTVSTLADDEVPLEVEFDWPESDPLIARQWVYNQKGVYQTMLLGGVASTEDAPAYSPVLSENTWEMIAQACADRDPILDSWLVGDEKDEVINGETLTFVIVGKDHDDLADGSGKAPLTFGMKNLMAETRQMNGSNTNSGGITGSEIHSWMQDTLLNQLPAELKSVLKSVNKKTSAGDRSTTVNTDAMKLFLFAEKEVYGVNTYSTGDEGMQYPYFATSGNRIKKLSNGTGAANYWWLRSPCVRDISSFCFVDVDGSTGYNAAAILRGVCFGFCI